MHSQTIKKRHAVLLALCIAIVSSTFFFSGGVTKNVEAAGGMITGWAWEGEGAGDGDANDDDVIDEGVGWVSLHCSTDPAGCSTGAGSWGLAVDDDGNISGYAYSEHLGWISAESADVTGCPVSPCAPSIEESGSFSGWLKALSATGGWDGWISLRDTNTGDAFDYGVVVSGPDVTGYAWGGTVVGWLAFTDAQSTYSPCAPNNACVDATHYDNLCTAPIENIACNPGLICSPGAVPCVTPPNANGTLELLPSLVPTGDTTAISWDAVDTISCRVFGENGDEWFGGATGSRTSSAIIQTTLYTLECTNGLGTATTTVDTAYAVVVPTWVEQ